MGVLLVLSPSSSPSARVADRSVKRKVRKGPVENGSPEGSTLRESLSKLRSCGGCGILSLGGKAYGTSHASILSGGGQ